MLIHYNICYVNRPFFQASKAGETKDQLQLELHKKRRFIFKGKFIVILKEQLPIIVRGKLKRTYFVE